MFSKLVLLRGFLLVLLVMMGFAGCSYFMDQKEIEDVVRLDREELNLKNCLGTTTEVFSDYWNELSAGENLDANIKTLAGCYKEAFDLFSRNVISGGDDPGRYDLKMILEYLQRVHPNANFDQKNCGGYFSIEGLCHRWRKRCSSPQ